MTSVLDDLHQLRATIRAEERVAGIRPDGHASEAVVRRRRRQLFLVGAVVLIGLAASALAVDVWSDHVDFLDARIVRVGMILLTVGVAVFLLEKEQHLKRLDQIARLVHERDLEVADRVLRSAAVADAGRSVGATLDLAQVIVRTLDRALELVDADGAWLLVPNADGSLHAAGARWGSAGAGSRLEADHAIASRAWVTAAPVLGGSDATPGQVMAAPVSRDGERLGVLVVARDAPFGGDDLEVLGRLAAVAGPAVGNARAHQAVMVALERTQLAGRLVGDEVAARIDGLQDAVARLLEAGDDAARQSAVARLRSEIARLHGLCR